MESASQDLIENEPEVLAFETRLPDRYQIKEVLGQGGMGTVLRAFDCNLDRDVAIKVLSGEFREEDRLRFLREAKTLASLDHVNVVRILSSGITDKGMPYHVMEYLEGESLASVLERSKTLEPGRFYEIFSQVLAGLAHAHSHNLTHRDLKPSNIMICRDLDGKALVKIIDFGIARSDEHTATGGELPALTRTNALLGSPPYMSPEQCRSEPAGELSDIYSIGCIMYECIAGKPPFAGSSGLDMMYRHLHETAPRLEPLASDRAGKRLAEAAGKCLAKEKRERIQSVEELQHELDEIFKNEGRSIPSFSLRNKRALVLLASLTTCLALLSCFILKFPWTGHTAGPQPETTAGRQSALKARLLSQSKHLSERIRNEIKDLNEGNKAQAKEEKVTQLFLNSNNFGNKILALARICDGKELSGIIAEGDRVLSEALVFKTAAEQASIPTLIRRGKCRLETGDLSRARSDFAEALAEARKCWGDNTEFWLDVYLQTIPCFIAAREHKDAEKALDDLWGLWHGVCTNPGRGLSSAQFLEPDGPTRLECVKEIFRQLKKTGDSTASESGEKARLAVKLAAIFTLIREPAEAQECSLYARNLIAGLPATDAEKTELSRLAEKPALIFADIK